jgi:hypothetical protein
MSSILPSADEIKFDGHEDCMEELLTAVQKTGPPPAQARCARPLTACSPRAHRLLAARSPPAHRLLAARSPRAHRALAACSPHPCPKFHHIR